jgi:glutaredoxin
MASRAVDLLIAYRVLKMLVTPFEKQPAFKMGIIDDKGKVLKKFRTLTTTGEKQSYTMLHRFVFNLKRILAKAGIRGALGSFAVAAALLLRENKKYVQHKKVIESTVITYLKENNLYEDILNESRNIPEVFTDDKFVMNCFGVDVFENNGELKSEFDYAKTL